jgi:hypothetical protein
MHLIRQSYVNGATLESQTVAHASGKKDFRKRFRTAF